MSVNLLHGYQSGPKETKLRELSIRQNGQSVNRMRSFEVMVLQNPLK